MVLVMVMFYRQIGQITCLRSLEGRKEGMKDEGWGK